MSDLFGVFSSSFFLQPNHSGRYAKIVAVAAATGMYRQLRVNTVGNSDKFKVAYWPLFSSMLHSQDHNLVKEACF